MSGNTPILSEDGSHTLLSERFGVTYHSHHGAIQETQTVFIDAGLHHAIERDIKDIRILEMGFGTGLNAIMTFVECRNRAISIDYHTVEAYPISMETVATLNYNDTIPLNATENSAYLQMHQSASHDKIGLSPNFSFTKYISLLQETELPSAYFHTTYFDAFAPNAQEELWSENIMSTMYETLAKGGCLVTYCAKGSFKRTLKAVGFELESLPGPKGKREMTRAVKL